MKIENMTDDDVKNVGYNLELGRIEARQKVVRDYMRVTTHMGVTFLLSFFATVVGAFLTSMGASLQPRNPAIMLIGAGLLVLAIIGDVNLIRLSKLNGGLRGGYPAILTIALIAAIVEVVIFLQPYT